MFKQLGGAKTNEVGCGKCVAASDSISLSVFENFARKLVLGALQHLHMGQVVLVERWQPSKPVAFGTPVASGTHTPWAKPELSARLTVNQPRFYTRVLTGGNIGAGESYVAGDWQVDDLTALVRIIARNQKLLQNIDGVLSVFSKGVATLAHKLKHNSKANAKDNILAHYDVGNTMYKCFLDSSMMYSAAMYPNADSTLAEAQAHKLKTICDKLELKPTDRVVEIGTGWGGLAIYAAQHYGCHVTTTTISDAQHAEAAGRIKAAGLEDKITLLKHDYRDLKAVTGGGFDKLVSIEMIEAVGHNYLDAFFDVCDSLLKTGGLMLIQAITYPDQGYARYLRSADFIQKHIFPGGCLLSVADMLNRLKNRTSMGVCHIEDFGFDYARTLHDWRSDFMAHETELKTMGYDDAFIRLWRFYFCYCEGGFLERSIGVVQLVAGKR